MATVKISTSAFPLLLILYYLCPLTSYGQCTLTFLGTYSSDWHTSGNWNHWQVPGPNDNVIIPTGKTVNINYNATCRTITVQAGGQVIKDVSISLTVTNAANTGNCAHKKVFLSGISTSSGPDGVVTGNLGGLAGADNLCQTLANTYIPGNTSTYKAWLSSTTVSAASRLTHATVPYRNRIDIVANNWADLTDGTINAPINRIIQSTTTCANCRAWTNTSSNGTLVHNTMLDTCDNWTSSATNRFGRVGRAETGITDSQWTSFTSINCSNQHAIYCIEQ